MDVKQMLMNIAQVNNEQLFPLFARITLPVTKEELFKVLRLKDEYKKFIISEEHANREHFHLLILSTESNKKNIKQNLRNLLKQNYPEMLGNESYSISETKTGTVNKMAAYTVKDDNFIYYGFAEAEIEFFQKLSYKKFDKKEFAIEMDKLQQEYLKDPFKDVNWFIQEYIRLKVLYNQVPRKQLICDQALLMFCKKNPLNTTQYIESVQDSFRMFIGTEI